MPTPGERRALIFIASVAALGVAARGWKEFHPQDPTALAGSRTALARQIQAVDSAISVSGSKRKPKAPRAAPPPSEPAPRPSRSRARPVAPADTSPRDPRQSYWDRAAHFDSIRLAAGRGELEPPRKHPKSAVQRPPSRAAVPPVDVDVAGTEELAAVPLIGPSLARRIVADRIEFGPFGSIMELGRVPGLTAAFTRRLAPFVTFSAAPRLGSAGERRPRSKTSSRPGGSSRP